LITLPRLFLYSLRREFVMEKRPARRSGPFLLVTYRCRSFGRAALSDFYYPCREPGSAGPVSGRRLAADRVSDPAIDSAGRVGFGSSCCFLSWEHRDNGSESAPFRKNKSGNSHCRHYVTFSLTYSGLHPSLSGCATCESIRLSSNIII
jgi:hypothetical protein